jgi:hypothetical protein
VKSMAYLRVLDGVQVGKGGSEDDSGDGSGGGGGTTYGWGKLVVVDKGKGRQRWLAGKSKRARLKRGSWAQGF